MTGVRQATSKRLKAFPGRAGQSVNVSGQFQESSRHEPDSLTREASPPQTNRQTRQNNVCTKKDSDEQKQPRLTHFLCLPLVNKNSRPHLDAGLSKLRQEIDGTDIPVRAVRPTGTLHLTLGVMSLGPEQLASAKKYLQILDLKKILSYITAQATAERAAEMGTVSENLNASAVPDYSALCVELRGLLPMHAPNKTSILYAEPRDETQRLQAFGEKLKREFTEKEFLVEDKRTLRMHATVVNTVYAKGRGRGGVLRFDARDMIDRYRDVVWAEDVRIDRVQICEMGAKKIFNGEGEFVGEEYVVVGEKVIGT